MTAFSEHTLLPLPVDLTFGEGHLRLSHDFRVAHSGVNDQRTVRAMERFVRDIRWLTGGRVSPELGDTDDAIVVIDVEESSDAPPDTLADESYVLTVSADGVLVEAGKIYGALHGLQTLFQLITLTPDGYRVPLARIVDQPRFGWRGLLLDAVRHWLPPHVIKRNLNAMAALKLNVFHWHLTDDQGFRIESRRFPRLHELGSDGNYYTQEEVRDIVEHARDRGIRVVPEFDMPGHTTSWFVGHPELASAPGPYAVSRKFGGHKATMDPTQDSTVQFVQEFLVEMMSLFPDRFIHLGGDEVDPEQWQSNAAIRRYMEQNGHEGPHDLLVDFHNRLHEFLREHGRESIGWDPLTGPKLDSRLVIQAVRGQQWVMQAIGSGHRAIASSEYYLDAMLPASYHYLKDPLDGEVADTTDEQRSLVLGAEASMWTEFATADNIDSRTWPRAAAVAERLWSPREVRDVADLYRRLPAVSRRLEVTGITHNSGPREMRSHLAGGSASSTVGILADVVEPITLEARWKLLARYTTSTPLDRLVDTAVPDGERPRTFLARVTAFVADSSDDVNYRWLYVELRDWAENHQRLTGLVVHSKLLTEVLPVSKALHDVAHVGLDCLGALQANESITPKQRKAHAAVLESAGVSTAEVTLPVIAGIRALLEAVPDDAGIAPVDLNRKELS